ncbi:hypothetical protein FRACYDRAFT_235383 [Fragilariopsis cylindrus CCMP1102]|uniref:TPR-like protein n=1 Tax=Fragilariopsis cylindrus CCMP1102 TaxID=635003 RepID=A0A1E7FMH2_9STRA|nr:hypothetical protein FRACYDRAFT_235383 [Fragilariopsis cylindrus CCMP1102]|eukprot:OEU19336.1 hypothetical protein FRACYDRAFT_235383 [Fragilariopsis cylindrus CCMP1102]
MTMQMSAFSSYNDDGGRAQLKGERKKRRRMDNDNVNPMMRDFRQQQQQQRSPRYHHPHHPHPHSDFDCYDDTIVDDDDGDTRQRPSPPRSASFVKSLMSGEVIHVKKENHHQHQHQQRNRRIRKQKTKTTPTTYTPSTLLSPSSFLTSTIGACTGITTTSSGSGGGGTITTLPLTKSGTCRTLDNTRPTVQTKNSVFTEEYVTTTTSSSTNIMDQYREQQHQFHQQQQQRQQQQQQQQKPLNKSNNHRGNTNNATKQNSKNKNNTTSNISATRKLLVGAGNSNTTKSKKKTTSSSPFLAQCRCEGDNDDLSSLGMEYEIEEYKSSSNNKNKNSNNTTTRRTTTAADTMNSSSKSSLLQCYSNNPPSSPVPHTDAYFNLGQAQLKIQYSSSKKKQHQYDLSVENLTIAHQIWERKHGPHHVAVGRALDALALAVVRRANHSKSTAAAAGNNNKNNNKKDNVENDLRYAQRLLEQAFAIRHHHLGVWHVDTVESYNKLASVYLHLGKIREACDAYREVFLVRRSIFGPDHPSVAITSHSIANCHYKLREITDSLKWYQISLDIYEKMKLPYRHPTVAKLLKDRSRLERYME